MLLRLPCVLTRRVAHPLDPEHPLPILGPALSDVVDFVKVLAAHECVLYIILYN